MPLWRYLLASLLFFFAGCSIRRLIEHLNEFICFSCSIFVLTMKITEPQWKQNKPYEPRYIRRKFTIKTQSNWNRTRYLTEKTKTQLRMGITVMRGANAIIQWIMVKCWNKKKPSAIIKTYNDFCAFAFVNKILLRFKSIKSR